MLQGVQKKLAYEHIYSDTYSESLQLYQYKTGARCSDFVPEHLVPVCTSCSDSCCNRANTRTTILYIVIKYKQNIRIIPFAYTANFDQTVIGRTPSDRVSATRE